MSPILFVLCMDPLSRKLNGLYLNISVKMNVEFFVTNHLLFFDDLKLFAEKETRLTR